MTCLIKLKEWIKKMSVKGMEILFNVIGGLGIFLFGMHHMSDGMQKLAGNKLKKVIGALTNNRIMAVGIGVFVTCLVQSSSVTTVMVVGFVNASLMTLKQALGVILGANIGTTITGWILVLKIGKYGLPIAGVGAIAYLFTKKATAKYRAMMVFGIGMVFLGLELMKNGFKPLRKMPEFVELFSKFQADSISGIILAACVGALMTAIVQSSSATLGITITLAVQGLITPETGVALVLGENVGTTITAFLASIGASVSARRAALAHTIVNVIGVTWVISIFPMYLDLLHNVLGTSPDPAKLLATAHTGFNITNAVLFIPFLGYLAKLLEKLIPEKEGEVEVDKLTHLDERMVETPAVAVEQVKEEIVNMSNDVKVMFLDFKDIIVKSQDKDSNEIKNIFEMEDRLDLVQKEISDLSSALLAHTDAPGDVMQRAKHSLEMADEYESISDYLMTLTKLHLKLKDNELELEELEKTDLLKLHSLVGQYFEFVSDIYLNGKTEEKLIEAGSLKTEISFKFKKIRDEHLDRFKTKEQEVFYSITYMDMLSYYRRISTHIFHVTESFA